MFCICIWRPYLMAHEGRCVATQEWQSSHSHTSQPPLSNFGFTRINPATIYFKGIKLEFGVLHLKTSSRLIHSQFHLGTCLPAWSPNEKRENRIVFRFCVSRQNNLLQTMLQVFSKFMNVNLAKLWYFCKNLWQISTQIKVIWREFMNVGFRDWEGDIKLRWGSRWAKYRD